MVMSSPKLDGEFFHWGSALISDGLSFLQNIIEQLQLTESLSQLRSHRLQLSLEDLEVLNAVRPVRLASMELLLQIFH